MRRVLELALVGVIGIVAGAGGYRFWPPRHQSQEECLMERMKFQPPVMFPTVWSYCQAHGWPGQPGMTDEEVGLTKKADDWTPVTPFEKK